MSENLISTELLDSYLNYTSESLIKLEEHVNALQNQEIEDLKLRQDIFGICHDIKGMGSSFNYPLMTEAGTSICHYLRKLNEEDTTENTLVEAHVKTMRVIMDNNRTGSGGDNGKQLID